MIVAEIARLVGGEIVCHKDLENKEIATACGSDMMSDVMAFYHDRGILLTGLVNVQVIRTASLLDIDAVCFVRGKKPTPEMIQLAQESDMPLITTTLPMFAACGILYNAGLKGNQGTDGI